jgi:hypothetical protein
MLKAMYLTKLKMATLVLVAVGTLTVGAVVLAQPPTTEGRPEREAQEAASRLKFEIRTWKDGQPSGTPVVVEAPGEGPFQVETADAVIEFRPKELEDRQGQAEAALRRAKRLVDDIIQLQERGANEPLDQLTKVRKQAKKPVAESWPEPATKKGGPLNDFIGKVSDRRPQWATKKGATKNEYPLDQPVPKGIDQRPSPATEQERRLGQLERKLDQILEALEGSKARKEMPLDPFHTEGAVKK